MIFWILIFTVELVQHKQSWYKKRSQEPLHSKNHTHLHIATARSWLRMCCCAEQKTCLSTKPTEQMGAVITVFGLQRISASAALQLTADHIVRPTLFCTDVMQAVSWSCSVLQRAAWTYSWYLAFLPFRWAITTMDAFFHTSHWCENMKF